MELNDVLNIILIFCVSGIFFVLPSTIYSVMFWGIFYRRRPLMLDSDDLKRSSYYPYRDELRRIITEAKKYEYSPVTIRSNDGLKLAAKYYAKDSDTTLVLMHGFQSNAYNNFSSLLTYFLSCGYNVLAVDQRAHGESEGHFTTTGCKEQYDLINWISWLEENTECESIFIYGISMGATTIGLASDKITSPKVKGLIMEAGFTSFYEELYHSAKRVFMKQAAMNYIVLCAKHLLKADIKQKAADSLSQTAIPVLFFHGSDDNEVPMSHTEENYNACASEKSLSVIEGAGHTLCHLVGRERVEKDLGEFITKYQS